MAKITVYKIRHKKTRLYRKAGGGIPGRWDKNGKAWPNIGHLKGHLNLIRDWNTNELPPDVEDWEVVVLEIEESEAKTLKVEELWHEKAK